MGETTTGARVLKAARRIADIGVRIRELKASFSLHSKKHKLDVEALESERMELESEIITGQARLFDVDEDHA